MGIVMFTQASITKHKTIAATITAALLACLMNGCAVIAVTDAVVTVAATAVKVGAEAVGVAADVFGAGVRAVTPSNNQKQ